MSKLKGEASVKRAVEDLLKVSGVPYWRMNSGKIKAEFGGWIQLCAKGTADLLAAPKKNGQRVFVWIETKAPGGKPTKEQLEFADYVRGLDMEWLPVWDALQLAEEMSIENWR